MVLSLLPIDLQPGLDVCGRFSAYVAFQLVADQLQGFLQPAVTFIPISVALDLGVEGLRLFRLPVVFGIFASDAFAVD